MSVCNCTSHMRSVREAFFMFSAFYSMSILISFFAFFFKFFPCDLTALFLCIIIIFSFFFPPLFHLFPFFLSFIHSKFDLNLPFSLCVFFCISFFISLCTHTLNSIILDFSSVLLIFTFPPQQNPSNRLVFILAVCYA